MDGTGNVGDLADGIMAEQSVGTDPTGASTDNMLVEPATVSVEDVQDNEQPADSSLPLETVVEDSGGYFGVD